MKINTLMLPSFSCFLQKGEKIQLGITTQLAVSESKASWVISLFVPQNENNVTSLVKFPLFMTFLTN